MERATHQTYHSSTQPNAAHFNPSSALTAQVPADGYAVLGKYQSGVTSMVGVIRVTAARDHDTWERHDHGDEVLVLLSGACTMILRDAEGHTIRRPLSNGDVLIIPRGVAHRATLQTAEAQLLFITPQTGTQEWSDAREVSQ